MTKSVRPTGIVSLALSFILLALSFTLSSPGHAQSTPSHGRNAPTPPMGWNSWDYFGTTLTESQAKIQADVMAARLLPAGYMVFTVDIQWYEPNAQGHAYQEGARLEMDAYSRLVPAVNRFPSAANGAGFKPLADYVHGKGLKFGIHLMAAFRARPCGPIHLSSARPPAPPTSRIRPARAPGIRTCSG